MSSLTNDEEGDLKVSVYEPSTQSLPPLRPYFRGVRERIPFIRELGHGAMKAKHYDTFLGQAWLLLDPLLLAGVYLLLRTVIRPPAGAGDQSDLIDHLVMGILFFQFFRAAALGTSNSITKNARFILNTSFPVGTFPLAALYEAVITFNFTFLTYLIVHAVLRQPWTIWIVFAPVFLLLLAALGFGIGLFTAPIATRIKDVSVFLPYVFKLWMFSSPVLYQVKEIPAHLAPYLKWNPVYPVYAGLEQVFDGVAPSPIYIVSAAAWGLSSLLIGTYYFLSRERDFALQL